MNRQHVDVCYLLSHGFAARMVLQTDVIPRIRERGISVAAIVPVQAEAAARNMEAKYGLQVHVAPDYVNAYRREYQILRRYMFEDVEKNPSLWPKHQLFRGSSMSRRIILDAYLLLNRLSIRSDSVRKALHRLERALLRSRESERILSRLQPGIVVSTYPVSRLESHIVNEAARKNITTVGHLLSWDNITAKGRFPSPPDHYLTWGPVMSSEVKEYYGKSDDDIHECGVAHFDRHLLPVDPNDVASLLEEHGLDPNHPYLFFGMSSPYIAPHEVDIVAWLADQVRSNRFGDDMQLLVRPHPQNISTDGSDSLVQNLAGIVGPRVAINYPEIKPDGLDWNMEESDLMRLVTLFSGSSITLNSGSTFAIDGLMQDKPVIITAFDGDATLPWYKTANRILSFHHIRKLIDFGGCYVADSFDSLAAGIDRYLEFPEADAEGREATRHGECGPCDGRTAERVAQAIEEILRGSHSSRFEPSGANELGEIHELP